MNVYCQKLRQKRKELNLCVRCQAPLDRKGVYCTECCKKVAEESRKTRQFWKDNGFCPRCGKNKLWGEEKSCPECKAKHYASIMKSREKKGKEQYNEEHRKWLKKAYDKKISEGICYRCGKRKADNGLKSCGICRAKHNEKRASRKKNFEYRGDRYKKGLCYFCDEPIKPGYKTCEKHYQINCENANKANREKLAKIINNMNL